MYFEILSLKIENIEGRIKTAVIIAISIPVAIIRPKCLRPGKCAKSREPNPATVVNPATKIAFPIPKIAPFMSFSCINLCVMWIP